MDGRDVYLDYSSYNSRRPRSIKANMSDMRVAIEIIIMLKKSWGLELDIYSHFLKTVFKLKKENK